MSGPIIPAELWPEGAHLHTWDSNGLGNWLRPSYGAWHLWASDIPLPPSHDWRVPVMRSQPAPAIDLEQFRSLARWVASSEGHRIPSWMRSHADRLLALIDGHAMHSDDTQRLEWLMRNISGTELRRLNVRTDANCDRAAIDNAMKPTKGEGE